MPTELEEYNTDVRCAHPAVENLVPFSLSQPEIFKTNGLLPIKDLKLLVRDYEQIAKDAITILINLSTDPEVLENIASDKEFINTLLGRITSPSEPNANLLAMLLANLAKHDSLTLSLLTLARPVPRASLSSTSSTAIDQLLDLFVRGADGTYNPAANYDYLSYLFADLAKHPPGRAYFLTPAAQTHDSVVPLCKLTVFTSHASDVRRKGVANTLKNAAFETGAHSAFLSEDEINVLPYLLLPLAGNEEYDEAEMLDMLPELQLLPVDKRRDADHGVLRTHVET
ncbi:Protein HGH1-like protein [Lachnellula willkommii]|uniref:Protein HGH1-like protein n=1 Tax=Lachnellula willkommii TaxID=215461 RepID=A0A559LZF4_9HELO|nr:Protein HGH1-like protein [Lachnellula willkommii]